MGNIFNISQICEDDDDQLQKNEAETDGLTHPTTTRKTENVRNEICV